MADIAKVYTHKVPDEIYGNTNANGGTFDRTYNGPTRLFVFVEPETGLLHLDEDCIVWNGRQETKDAAVTRAGLSRRAILLQPSISDDDTFIADFFFDERVDNNAELALPDGEVYFTYPDPMPLRDIFDDQSVYYDFATESWKIDDIKFKDHTRTLAQHQEMRDNFIAEADRLLTDEEDPLSDADAAKITAYKTELQNLYTKFDGIKPLFIPYPEWPLSPGEPGPDAE